MRRFVTERFTNPSQFLEVAIRRNRLGSLVGDAVACFVLTRELNTPGLVFNLIQQIHSVNSVTKHHIALILFYGDRVISQNAQRPFSVSSTTVIERHFATWHDRNGEEVFNHYSPRPVCFDDEFERTVRANPKVIDKHLLSDYTQQGTDSLMSLYDLEESAVPSLLLIDPHDVKRFSVVPIENNESVESVYNRILRPLAAGLATHENWNDKRALVQSLDGEVDKAVSAAKQSIWSSYETYRTLNKELGELEEQLSRLPPTIESIEQNLNDVDKKAVWKAPSRELERAGLKKKLRKTRRRIEGKKRRRAEVEARMCKLRQAWQQHDSIKTDSIDEILQSQIIAIERQIRTDHELRLLESKRDFDRLDAQCIEAGYSFSPEMRKWDVAVEQLKTTRSCASDLRKMFDVCVVCEEEDEWAASKMVANLRTRGFRACMHQMPIKKPNVAGLPHEYLFHDFDTTMMLQNHKAEAVILLIGNQRIKMKLWREFSL